MSITPIFRLFVFAADVFVGRSRQIACIAAGVLASACMASDGGRATQFPLATRRALATGQPIKIVCFGDSVTGTYYHSGGRRGWCELLEIALHRIYPASHPDMINAGVSGNTSADGLKRLDRDVLNSHPQLVVVMFGLNDVARDTPAHLFENLTEIVRRIRDAGSEVMLMTPNSVYDDDPRRPVWKVRQYVEIVRQAAERCSVPLVDCFRSYEGIRSVSHYAWVHLMSDPIHPNLEGQKIFAEDVARAISGQQIYLEQLPPHHPGLPALRAKLQNRQPVKVVVMQPFDKLIVSSLQSLFPGADVQAIPWNPINKSLSELADEARGKAYNKAGATGDPDLIVIAVPAESLGPNDEEFYRSYSTILNRSLPTGKSAGKEGWNCIAVLPSVLQPDMDQGQQVAERLALMVIRGKDIDYLTRTAGDSTSPQDMLTQWLKSLLE
jgi:lysophospholipase L1-like esterase